VRAAVLTAYGQPLEIDELTAPDLWPTGVRVQVDASGVCHSDLLIRDGDIPYPLPVVLGHEGAGTVIAVGDAVTHIAVGDRVICSFLPACGSCWFCQRGSSNLCTGIGDSMLSSRGTMADGASVFGMSGLGTFADELVTDQDMVVPVKTDLPAEQLALIGCGVTTGLGAVFNQAAVEPGATVAVIGCGGVGQAVIQGARIAGAARVFAIDPLDHKRTSGLAFGATDAIDPMVGDPVAQVHEATGGRGADYAFEAVGRPETMLQAWATLRRGGTAVVIGMPAMEAQFTLSAVDLMTSDKRIAGCLYGSSHVRRDFPRFVELAESGRLDLEGLVTRRIALTDVNDALDAVERGDVIRSVICQH
jgi:S-(hydroxymethyl)glutathione dehydrogenase / alcohol dehydrogenase